MMTSRVLTSALCHRLDSPFYHPKALRLDHRLNEIGNLRALSEIIDQSRTITNGVRGPVIQSSDYRLVRLQDFDGWFVCFDTCLTISEQQFWQNRRCQLRKNDIIVAIGGYIGHAAIVREVKPAVIGQHSALIPFPENAELDPHYLTAYLNANAGRIQLQRFVSGTVQTGVNLEDLRDVRIPIFTSSSQRYIGDKVRLADRLRKFARVLTANISECMEQCFRGHPRPPQKIHSRIASQGLNPLRMESEFYAPLALWADEEIKGSQWRHARLADAAVRIKDGPGGWGVSTNDYVEQGVPVIRGVNLIDGECDLSDCVFITQAKHRELRSHCVYRGNVLLSVRGTIGRSAVFDIPNYDEASINAAVVTIECKEGLLPHYLAEFFNTEIGRIQSERMGNGAVQQNMNLTETGENLVVIPPMDFQAEIAHLRQKRLAYARYSAQMIKASRQLVEALIENKLTENELAAAAATLEQGDRTLDRAILARLTEGGIDEEGKQKLFPDLDALYAAIDEAAPAHTDGEPS